MFQRLESVLHSEIKSLGHRRGTLLGFAVAMLAYTVLPLQRVVEQALQAKHAGASNVISAHAAVACRPALTACTSKVVMRNSMPSARPSPVFIGGTFGCSPCFDSQ